ncbi:hypothetical protein PSTT_05956 [Puccinia striiformis]|uniref:Dyp-type peroxidase n=1 Tax=Puccinia striiformis TaxID=27350 RepID=A0A2S4VM20_9BASI|nr:hypothetical protein PSTT_05956 [Puccinia striiformis]
MRSSPSHISSFILLLLFGLIDSQVTNSQSSSTQVDLTNIQGDIIIGLQKRYEAFWFCTLNSDPYSIESFRQNLKSELLPLISTTQDVIDTQKEIDEYKRTPRYGEAKKMLPITHVNIGFSYSGLKKLGLKTEEIPTGANEIFSKGQKSDALTNLGDPVDQQTKELKTWSEDFLDDTYPIDFVVLVTAPDLNLLNQKLRVVQQTFDRTISSSFLRRGNVRPGRNFGHEHFGYKDSISRPKIAGVNARPKDKKAGIVEPGVILLGQPSASGNTSKIDPHQAWTKDGSFMVFRELQQLVPEFQTFCDEAAEKLQNSSISSDHIGARIVGRWKSGAPLSLAPNKDNPALNSAQDFDYSDELKQERCPYASHVRKTNPRNGAEAIADPQKKILPHLMVRNGIPYGPELTDEESFMMKTRENRGLLFVAYQSQIDQGFQLVQEAWCNNPRFPERVAANVSPGYDLRVPLTHLLYHVSKILTLYYTPQGPAGGTDPNNVVTAFQPFVIPLGGEYFLMPSIKAITEKLGL